MRINATLFHDLFIYYSKNHLFTMKSIMYVGIIAVVGITMATTGFGMSVAIAQMADNATMGNMTSGGNMTMGAGNMTGTISGCQTC
jgi:hypothetical protein